MEIPRPERPASGHGWPDSPADQEARLLALLARRGAQTGKGAVNGLGLRFWIWRGQAYAAIDRLVARGQVVILEPGQGGSDSWCWRKPRYAVKEI